MQDIKLNINSGIVFMLCFCLLGPLIDVFAKLASAEISPGQLVLTRFGVQAALLFPLGYALGLLHRPTTMDFLCYFVRGSLMVTASGFFFAALAFMPIVDALAIFFVEPLILTLLGGLILAEPIGWRRIGACLAGLIGVLLVIQPQFSSLGWPSLYPLVTAVLFAFYLLLSRSMSRTNHPIALQAYTGLAGIIFCLLLLLLFSNSGYRSLSLTWPSETFLFYALACALMATLAHLFISFAFALAPVSVLAPLQYLEILCAAFFGFIVFDDIPNAITISGLTVIISAGLYVLFREKRLKNTSRS